MKNQINYSILPLAITGFFLILIVGCSKDKDDKDDINNPPPLNIATVEIPGGTFTMGSPTSEGGSLSDETEHQVTLSAFKLSKYEITNRQFAIFLNAKKVGSNGLYAGGAYPNQILTMASNPSERGLNFTNLQWIPVAGYENNPANKVSWYGASEFAIYAGGRLPTEAEWEYSCRANTITPFSTGSCLTDKQAVYDWTFPYRTCTNSINTGLGYPQAVGSFPANAYGLHEMHGNILEWCSDWYGPYQTVSQTNPIGPLTGTSRVVRGGKSGSHAQDCRSADRYYIKPNIMSPAVGFRVAFVP